MAIAKVGTTTNQSFAAATTPSAVTINSTTAGNCLVVITTSRSTTAAHTIAGTGFTFVSTGAFNGGSINTSVSIAYALNIPGGATSINVTGNTSSVKAVTTMEFSGVDTAGQPDTAAVSKGTGTSSTTPTSSAITTTTAGSLIVTVVATAVNNSVATYATAGPSAAAGTIGTWVLGANYSNAGGTNASVEQMSAYVLGGAAGLYTTQWTTPSNTYSSWAIALKAAAGGGGAAARFKSVSNYHQSAVHRAASF